MGRGRAKLLRSLPATYDTLYGGSWSADGTLIAFGAADNAVRAIDSAAFKPVIFMAAHEDLVRGTAFSGDGKSLFSASRDMTVKMTDVVTQRFQGNLTTHTPGVLRGGMQAIDRHPQRNEVLVGSADGSPKLFRMEVTAAGAGGGNPNQIREYETMLGRVFDVRFSRDGMRLFATSSLDGKGQVRGYETDSGKRLWQVDVVEGGMYALSCSADGTTLAAAGADGQVRVIHAASGQVHKTFLPVELAPPPRTRPSRSRSPTARARTCRPLSATWNRSSRAWAATPALAMARPRARTASSSRCAATIRCSIIAP